MAVYQDTVGLRIYFTLGFDVSGGDVRLVIDKPGGDRLTKMPVVSDVPTGACYYDAIAGDLDEYGNYDMRSWWYPDGFAGARNFPGDPDTVIVLPTT